MDSFGYVCAAHDMLRSHVWVEKGQGKAGRVRN